MNERLLKKLLEESLIQEYAEFDNAPEHKFSLKHRLAMKRIFARFERNIRIIQKPEAAEPRTIDECKPHRSLKQRLIIAAVIIILMTFLLGWSIVLFDSKGFRGILVDSGYTEINVTDLQSCPKIIECEYALAAVPEGFELIESNSSRNFVYTLYSNDSTGQIINFTQWIKTEYSFAVDTNDHKLEKINVNGKTGVLVDFGDETGDHYLFAWDNGDYIIQIMADLNKTDTLNLFNITKL